MGGDEGIGRGNGKDPVVAAIHELTAEVHKLQHGQGETNSHLEAVEQVLRGHTRQLGEVVDRLGRVEGRLERVEEHLGHLDSGLAGLRAEVHEGFAELGEKIESAASRDRRLEDGLQQLGERVARLEGRNPEPR